MNNPIALRITPENCSLSLLFHSADFNAHLDTQIHGTMMLTISGEKTTKIANKQQIIKRINNQQA
jgi:hypothetical protein